jgi:hypothetical protein
VLFFLVLAKNEESTEFWKISCTIVIYTKKATQKMSIGIIICAIIVLNIAGLH